MRWTSGRIVVAAGAALFLTAGGCAYLFISMTGYPGWHYAAVGGSKRWREGLRYEVPDQNGVGLVVYAGAGPGSIHTALDITNRTGASLTVDAEQFRLIDAAGNPIPVGEVDDPECDGQRAKHVVIIAEGKTCRFSHHFLGRLLVGKLPWQQRNPDLRALTLEASATPDAGTGFAVRVPLAWDE